MRMISHLTTGCQAPFGLLISIIRNNDELSTTGRGDFSPLLLVWEAQQDNGLSFLLSFYTIEYDAIILQMMPKLFDSFVARILQFARWAWHFLNWA